MSPWPAELHAGQRLRRLTNTFLLWANRHSSWVTDEWACLCVCAPDSSVYVLRGVVEERNVFFFWGVAAFRRRMSAHMCVPEVQVRLCWTCWLYIGETQMWFLKCFFFPSEVDKHMVPCSFYSTAQLWLCWCLSQWLSSLRGCWWGGAGDARGGVRE